VEVVQGINCANHCLGREGPILNDIKILFSEFQHMKDYSYQQGQIVGYS
jgi:hypothetical protein